MKKYFLYARKSSDSEEKQTLSIEAQLFELKDFIKSKMPDSLIVSEFTESKTAKEPGRPIFNKMISRIEKGEAEGIIAWHPDRLARNSVDGGKIIHLIDKGFIKFLEFPTYSFDNTAQGKFMLNIIFGQSKYSVDNLSENIKRGIRQKLRRGEWPGYANLGYANNYKTKKIDIDLTVSPKIIKLFETYATGNHSLADMARLASSMGLTGKKGGMVRKNIVQRILTNPVYYGNFIYKGEMHEGTHEPIISKELFNKAQEVMNSKKRIKESKHKFIFRGLIRCGICGCMVTAETQKGHFYYRCTKKRNIVCDTKYIREEALVVQMDQKISLVSLPSKIIDYFKEQIKAEKSALMNSCTDETRQTEKTINDLETKANRLMDIYLEGAISKSDFIKRKGESLDKKYLLQQKLNHLEKGQFVWLEHLEEFINGLTTVKNVVETDDLVQKREFLEKTGSNFLLKLTAASEEARAGGSGATSGTGGGSKKQVTKTKNSVRLDFDFKNFWLVLEEETKKAAKNSVAFEKSYVWRRGRDSNPRSLAGHSISSAARSTTLTPLRINAVQFN